jgi:hypothetical protein
MKDIWNENEALTRCLISDIGIIINKILESKLYKVGLAVKLVILGARDIVRAVL